MAVHLINPTDNSFGTAVITPRWLFVLAVATPASLGDPVLVDESLKQLDPSTIHAGDVVGISVHTGNALRGYEVGKLAYDCGANGRLSLRGGSRGRHARSSRRSLCLN